MEVRYDDHTSHYLDLSRDETGLDRALKANIGTLDVWRKERTVSPLIPFFKNAAADSWLTVGDGVFGFDAVLLMRMGIDDVHASDLSDHLLRQSAARGVIKNYSGQNAEAMSFPESAFDFVFCQNSYHHFPRPILAMYEMLRVCRHAVVLVEPPDPMIGFNLRAAIQPLFGKSFHDFEEVGNYVYSVSEREFEKLLLGSGIRHCAFRAINDRYTMGMEHVPATGGTIRDRLFRLKVQLKGLIRDTLSNLRIIPYNCLLSVLFKTPPTEQEIRILRNAGFRIRELPRNPYAKH